MLEIGSLVDGKYKILNKVGQGGMSVVYMAINEKANKTWAVKEVRKDGVLNFESVKQGLVAETNILKKLSHPNLPSIIDVIDTEDSFIIIMDYVQGNSLNKALEEYGAQPQEYVIEWAKQLCDVLGYLHSRQPPIIYRDMKPANIMLKPDGNVTLIDFGTAREFKEKNLADTTCLGTVGYTITEKRSGDYKASLKIFENGTSDNTIAKKLQSLPLGAFAKIKFKVSESCDVGQAINYRVTGTLGSQDMVVYAKWNSDFTMVVTEQGGSIITVPKTETGYSVSMGADQQLAAGQKVRIPVTVASSEKNITGFNAYDMTFTYDPAALTLNTTSDSAANLTVEDSNGTVRVRRYGTAVALGEALALEFTANKATSSTVTLTAAKFDLDANSINFDAPAATITDADTTVKALWNVSLPDGFVSAAADGSTLVENGADFTFKAVDSNYEYTLNITTNGKTEEVTVKGGSYTIENVTDNVQVTVVNKVGRTYTLKFVGSGVDAGLVTPTTATVQYPNDYDFTVKFPGTGYKTTVKFAPSDNKFDVERLENGDYAYKLLGNYLVGDENGEITVTVEKVENTAKKDIIVAGSGSEAFSADNALTFYAGENYTFKLDKNEQYYDYELVVWYTDSSNHTVRPTPKDNGDGTYTIVNMPNADMHITIHKMAKALDPDAVDVVKYLELDNKTMYMVTVWGELSHTNLGSTNTTYIAYTYDDNLMYDTSYYTAPNGTKGASSWLVIVDKGEEFTKEEALKHLKLVESTQEQNKNISLVYFGIDSNVNGSKGGQLDINDVQLVYDMYNSLYENFEQVSVKKFLLADQTLNRQLNSADAVKLADKLGY